MSIVSRAEFAQLSGVTVNYISVYIGRGKIKMIDDGIDEGKIDTDDPVNIRFTRNLKTNEIKTLVKKTEVIKQSVGEVKKKQKVPISKEDKAKHEEERKHAKAYAEWERRKDKANAIKAEKEAELKTLQVEKMMGQLIPVDLVHQILKINIQNIFVGFESELQNLASVYCDILAGGDRGKLSEIITKMRENLERIIAQTKKNAAKEIEGTIEEYAETRNRGERS